MTAASPVSPHSLEAERAVLGGIFVDPDRYFDVADLLAPADFFRAEHGYVFSTFRELAEKGQAIDPLIVRERLKAKGQLDAVNDAYLFSLMDGMPRASNVAAYGVVVREKADRRRLILVANKILTEISVDEEHEVRVLVDRAEQAIFEIGQKNVRRDFIDAAQLVSECFQSVQRLVDERKGVTGVSTGFMDFDELTRGFQRGTLSLIAARPSMGKTAFALNIAYQAAVAEQQVGFFSLEMSRDELFLRLLTSVARIDGHRLQGGYVSQADYARISQAIEQIAESYLHIDDTPVMTILDIRGKARRLKAKRGLSLIVLDYLQLMQLPKAENRNIAVADVSRGLKLLARELDVPVVALSQLSRDTERRSDKRPMLSDLRDSGALEQDADLVVFIHRPEVYSATDDNAGLAEIIIAKHRNGPIGSVKLRWSKESTRFDNWSYQ